MKQSVSASTCRKSAMIHIDTFSKKSPCPSLLNEHYVKKKVRTMKDLVMAQYKQKLITK